MVGLGSYLVNVVGDCNGCHSNGPSTEHIPSGNPYLRKQPSGPFDGMTNVNPATYLGGGRDFGVLPNPGGTVHIVSRNLTPDKSGLAEGGHTLSEFMQLMRTGVDIDHAHPNWPANAPNCLPPPFDGDKLQIMPWPAHQNMTDRQLSAIYTYLSAIPCIEGGPASLPPAANNRMQARPATEERPAQPFRAGARRWLESLARNADLIPRWHNPVLTPTALTAIYQQPLRQCARL